MAKQASKSAMTPRGGDWFASLTVGASHWPGSCRRPVRHPRFIERGVQTRTTHGARLQGTVAEASLPRVRRADR
jgi:hypothetical protein